MKQANLFFISLIILSVSSALYADWRQELDAAWEKTKHTSQKAYDKTRQYGKEAYEVSKEYGKEAYDSSKQYADKITKSLDSNEEETPLNSTREDRFNTIWTDLLSKMTNARSVYDDMEAAPESSWFKTDKSNYREDFNELLDEIIALLEDDSVTYTRQRVGILQDLIKQKQIQIAKHMEERISAPVEHVVKTTKAEHDKKIENLKTEISEIKEEIVNTKVRLANRLQELGINLNTEQLTVLLTRVDSENIIEMSVVFEILKDVTVQLMELTKSSGENIETAKKYYGMHVVLMEAVVHIQDKYIELVSKKYIPKLDDIVGKTNELKSITLNNLKVEQQEHRRSIYQNNLKAQDITIKTAELYKKMIYEQRQKVAQARSNSYQDLKLAANTYATVQISSELLKLLNESKNAFDVLMNLQAPEIIPFENLEIQKRFEQMSIELTKEAV